MKTTLQKDIHTIWDYHHMNHRLQKADAIVVLGSHDEQVARRGAEIFNEGYAPWIIFSGGRGRHTEDLWAESEARHFAGIAQKLGVPRSRMLLEEESTNTGQNAEFSHRLAATRSIRIDRILVVTKPYMERRAYATFRKVWPSIEVLVASPQGNFEHYLETTGLDYEFVTNVMVGDLQRIKLYGQNGFQMQQEIPGEVWRAFERLVAAGYDKQLIRS